jgi:hypothetical protein
MSSFKSSKNSERDYTLSHTLFVRQVPRAASAYFYYWSGSLANPEVDNDRLSARRCKRQGDGQLVNYQ